MNVEGYLLTTRQEVRYLGVQLDCRRRFGTHLEKVCGKANALMGAFRSLSNGPLSTMISINGPTGSVRRLYYGVWESVVLYTAPVWAKRSFGPKNIVLKRRISRSSTTPVQELGPPQSIKRGLWHWRSVSWRNGRRFYRENNWAKRLVANACLFRRYRRNIDHFTMQILTGHGIFNVYRKMINKEDHSRCWHCNTEGDDAEHALFHCPGWIRERTELENYVGTPLTTENLMVKKEDDLTRFQALCRKIMLARMTQEKFEERRRTRNTRRRNGTQDVEGLGVGYDMEKFSKVGGRCLIYDVD
ncbi:uncharacterized protein [Bombus flavifrons]|uniref:uncharacterized protein n=1 Tax=Bombus flavifrons TaxID=103934 RepID=UPI003703766F